MLGKALNIALVASLLLGCTVRSHSPESARAAALAELLAAEDGVSPYDVLIGKRVAAAWYRPESVLDDRVAEVEVLFDEAGMITSATLVSESGNDEFDRSVLEAVRRVEAVPELARLAQANPKYFAQAYSKRILRFAPLNLDGL